MPCEDPYAPSLWPRGVSRMEGSSGPRSSYREILGVPRLAGTREAGDDSDTTPDTTHGATRINGEQPQAKKPA
jgi:hypothetical protein